MKLQIPKQTYNTDLAGRTYLHIGFGSVIPFDGNS